MTVGELIIQLQSLMLKGHIRPTSQVTVMDSSMEIHTIDSKYDLDFDDTGLVIRLDNTKNG